MLGADNCSIGFSPEYWVVILAAVDEAVKVSKQAIERPPDSGKDPESLSPERRIALVGPLIVRGAIVDVLVKNGVMKRSAADAFGYDALRRMVGMPETGERKKR